MFRQLAARFGSQDRIIWFHAASLGEFEQARPIIEALKKKHKHYKILITFFSPSGYEVRKNYNLADVVCYLPLDSKWNAKKFIASVNPTLAIFIKYEFWPNILNELQKKKCPRVNSVRNCVEERINLTSSATSSEMQHMPNMHLCPFFF